MKNLKGWRTIIWNALLIGAPLELSYLSKIDWTHYLSPTWTPVVVGIIGVLLRLVTSTPPGAKE